MRQKKVFLLSGQGSQYYRMGAGIYAEDVVFRRCMDALDAYAFKSDGFSIVQILYHDGKDRTEAFFRTLHTHAALFAVQFSLAQALIARGVVPDYLLGSSLGEYVAAALAGVATPEAVLRALLDKARLAERFCEPGGMLAVFHDSAIFEQDPVLRGNSTLASINHDQHFVLSGTRASLERVLAHLQSRQIACVMLPISHGFHSPAMDPSLRGTGDAEAATRLMQPQVPLISCLVGGALQMPPSDYFWQIGRRPILFREAVAHLLSIETAQLAFIDVGPGATLSGFLKRLLPTEHPHLLRAIMPPFQNEMDGLQRVVNQCSGSPLVKFVKEQKSMYAYIFPGQGSQRKGMGAALFGKYPAIVARADSILGYSVAALCLDDVQGQLDDTFYTQPALYVVNALSYIDALANSGVAPAFVAGHSLGEYAALFAAGVVDFELGLRLVLERARLMSQAKSGGMAAVLGMDEHRVREVLKENGLANVDIANLNTPSQIVMSGGRDEVKAAQQVLERDGACKGVVPLPVSGAFHSRLMRPAQEAFERFLASVELSAPQIPVISNVTARPYDLASAKRLLADQISHSVRWSESVRYMWAQGVEDFRELGHGRVLTNLVTKIKAEATPLTAQEMLRDTGITQAVPLSSEIKAGALTPEATRPSQDRRPPIEPLTAASRRAVSDPTSEQRPTGISAADLGCPEFKNDYGLTYAYVCGGMFHGIASVAMLVRTARARMLAFFGTGGLTPEQVAHAILKIKDELGSENTAFGMSLSEGPHQESTVALILKHSVRNIEISAYGQASPSIVRYRLSGFEQGPDGRPIARNRIIAKVCRPEVAVSYLDPAPTAIVDQLLRDGVITKQQAAWSRELPMADDICVVSDGGGHTNGGVASALLPAICRQRDQAVAKHGYAKRVRVGSAGGIGTAEAAACAFVLGADFIVTGSINQCTVEAGTSDAVKDLLQAMEVQDTDYAPSLERFENGARVQVLKRGTFFAARAKKLYDVYSHADAIEKLDVETARLIQDKYLHKSFEDVFEDCRMQYPAAIIDAAEQHPKRKMALIFKWYLAHGNRVALEGDLSRSVDFQVYCGPALGGFNQWVKGTPLEKWRNRHVDTIGIQLMNATAALLSDRLRKMV